MRVGSLGRGLFPDGAIADVTGVGDVRVLGSTFDFAARIQDGVAPALGHASEQGFLWAELEAGDVVIVEDEPKGWCVRWDMPRDEVRWLDRPKLCSWPVDPSKALVYDSREEAETYIRDSGVRDCLVVHAPPEAIAAAKKRDTIPAPPSVGTKARGEVCGQSLASFYLMRGNQLVAADGTVFVVTCSGGVFAGNPFPIECAKAGVAGNRAPGAVLRWRPFPPPHAPEFVVVTAAGLTGGSNGDEFAHTVKVDARVGVRGVRELSGDVVGPNPARSTDNALPVLACRLFIEDNAADIELRSEASYRLPPDQQPARDRAALTMWQLASPATRQRYAERAARLFSVGGK
jgi:hypothetical protein